MINEFEIETSCEKCRYLILKTTMKGPLCFKGHNLKDEPKNCNSFDGNITVGMDYAKGKSELVRVFMRDGKITGIECNT